MQHYQKKFYTATQKRDNKQQTMLVEAYVYQPHNLHVLLQLWIVLGFLLALSDHHRLIIGATNTFLHLLCSLGESYSKFFYTVAQLQWHSQNTVWDFYLDLQAKVV